MKNRYLFIIFKKNLFLILVIAMSLIFILPNTSATDDFDNDFSYLKNKKVVVLLDNSGSMLGRADSVKQGNKSIDLTRMDFALYSLGILASTLNSDDSLAIVPLNASNQANVNQHIDIDLKNSNRVQAVNDAYQGLMNITNSSGSYASGGTPFGNISSTPVAEPANSPVVNALHLLDAPKSGTTQGFSEDNTEYWFIVLSDGAFSGMSDKNPEDLNKHLSAALSPYQQLHTIYIGFAQGLDLSATSFVNTVSNSAYLANDGASLIETMKKVSNQVSGKYDLNTTSDNWNSAYSINDNKITIELDNIGFSLKDVSFLLQKSSASLKSIELVVGKNKTALMDYQISSYSQKPGQSIGNYKCLIGKVNYGNNKVFPTGNGEKLVFTFDQSVEGSALSIFAEPALYIQTYYQYLNKNVWTDCDELFISSTLRPNDKIRVGYHILDATNNAKIPTNLFDYSKLTYCGSTYTLLPDEANSSISLVKDSNELSIEVGIKSGNSTSYSLYTTVVLDIQENPTTFRVEGSITEINNNNNIYQNVIFNVFADDKPVNKQDLLNGFEYLLTIKEPNSLTTKKIDKKDYTISDDGTINYQIPCNSYGDYKAEFKILRNSNGALRGKTLINTYIPQNLKVEYIGDDISLSELDVSDNKIPMEFKLSSDGKDFSFESNLIKYQVILEKGSNQIDVTKYAVVNGGVLTFVPNKTSLGKDLCSKGELTLNVKIMCDEYPTLSTFTTGKIIIREPVYKVELIENGNNEIDLYDLKHLDTTILVKFTIDGESLTTSQIRKEIRDNNIRLDYQALGPTRVRQKIVEYEDGVVVELKVLKTGIFKLLMTSFTFKTETPVVVKYQNSEVKTKLEYKQVPFMSRVWVWIGYIVTILVIAYIGIAVWGIVFKTKMLFRGAGRACIVFTNNRVKIIPINTRKDYQKYIFKRFGWIVKLDQRDPAECDDARIKNIDGMPRVDYDLSNCQGAFVNRYNEFSDYSDKMKQIIMKISELYYDYQVIDSEVDNYRDLVNENRELFKNDYETNDKNPYSLSKQELNDIFNERECELEKYDPEEEYQYDFDSNRFFVEYRHGEVVKVIKFI